ncbi:MAG: hypothetical protein U1F43_35195 [Myxococcota bacterium]
MNDAIKSLPKRGNGNVGRALKEDVAKLARSGLVVAVIDRDKARDLWKKSPPPVPDCKSGIAARLRSEAPRDYELIFLEANVETLVERTCMVLGRVVPAEKPTPLARDGILADATWRASRTPRDQIRAACPSFDQIVKHVVCLTPAEVVQWSTESWRACRRPKGATRPR